MDKKNIDWANIGFGYMQTDYRFVSQYKNGAWDEGALTTDANIVLNECAGVLQYAQTCFEGLKAYTTEDGHIVRTRYIVSLCNFTNRFNVIITHRYHTIEPHVSNRFDQLLQIVRFCFDNIVSITENSVLFRAHRILIM